MSAAPAPGAKPVHGEAGQGIAFRPESTGIAADATGVLLVLVALLGAATAALWFAKKKGWLSRWALAPGIAPPATAHGLRVEQALRLSPRTMLYRVSGEAGAFLVVESSVQARLTALADKAGERADG